MAKSTDQIEQDYFALFARARAYELKYVKNDKFALFARATAYELKYVKNDKFNQPVRLTVPNLSCAVPLLRYTGGKSPEHWLLCRECETHAGVEA